MVSLIKPRPTQTKVKHIILEKYLTTWGGIIINSLQGKAKLTIANGKPFSLHLVYVDCFAGVGRYSKELGEFSEDTKSTIFGSPIIGIKALDSLKRWALDKYGLRITTSAILIEENFKHFTELKNSLDLAAFSSRMKETKNFTSLRDGEIALIQGDSTSMIDDLLSYTKTGYKFSFYLLDPYGPKGIPLSFVSKVICNNQHDVMINMPYQDLHKKTGFVTKIVKDADEEKILTNYTDMFGNTGWQKIVEQIELDANWQKIDAYSFGEVVDPIRKEKAIKLELELVDYYREVLRSVDCDLAVKSIGLSFPDRERTMFYLYLITHDPDGALAMNEILWDADYQENELRWKLKSLLRFPEQYSLFDSPISTIERAKRTSIEDIANQIFGLFRGQSTNRKMIYKALLDESYFAKEINQAITHLKNKKKLIDYHAPLNNYTEIYFSN